VEGDAARPRRRDRADHLRAALREAFEVRAVVERRRELRAVPPDLPEVARLDDVERDVDGLDRPGTRRGVGTDFVLVAQVDDGPDAVGLDFLPPARLEACRSRSGRSRRAA
jgi:hypothetical protein